MPLSIDRPPFILAFVADTQGCGFHRVMTPLASLVNSGAVDGRIDMQVWPDEVVLAAKPDVIVWQRQVEDGQVEAMKRWRGLLPDALFVYEVDDYLSDIPDASFHASYMPPDLVERIATAMAVCDRVTTTTEPLALWLRSLGAKDVRVVPNGLPQDRLREHAPNSRDRIRIGFAGGISHGGDLEIIRHVMATVHEEVTWVFMGMQPEEPDARTEFHDGVQVQAYLDKMASLDLDLMLAPLEDNAFNRCKSNLRLLETGAIGASVIAQDMPCYREDKPPVFAYATTPEEWTDAVRRFILTSQADRARNAEALRSWVGRHYTLERLLTRRLSAWLPQPGLRDYWKPRAARDAMEPPIIACLNATDIVERLPFLKRHRVINTGLEDACRRAIAMGTGVLWLRPATTIDEGSWDRIAIATDLSIASVTPLAGDGWSAFPDTKQWNPMPPEVGVMIAGIVGEEFAGRKLIVPAPSGPAVLLSRHALSMIGIPDVEGCDGNEEQALFEWGLRACARQWTNIQAVDAFASSVAPPAQPTQKTQLRMQARGTATWLQKPAETLSAEERERVELTLFRRQWGGPRPGSMGFGQDYESVDLLRRVRDEDAGMSEGLPTIEVLNFNHDESLLVFDRWITWIDNSVAVTDMVALRQALATVDEDVIAVYGDHDSVIGGQRSPEFKPDFDLELLFAQDYVTPVCAVRADALDHVPTDRNDLWSMLVDIALVKGRRAFEHVPKVLGRMTINTAPEMLAVETLNRQVMLAEKLGESADVTAHRTIPGCLSIVRRWRAGNGHFTNFISEAPLVSIVIPTLGSGRLIQPCVATVLRHTTYPNFEVIIVQNGGREKPELSPATAVDPRVRVVRWDGGEFNWAAINNAVIREHAKGEYVVTLNDDVMVAAKTWLDAMMGHVVRPEVGAVGAKLAHPMGVVQHVGVVCHKGIAGHLHLQVPLNQAGHLGRAMLTHESLAVTGACMLFSRANFDLVGGFDERFSHNYNDVVFCLDLHEEGLVNVVEISAELIHAGGTSRAALSWPKGAKLMVDEGRMLADRFSDPDPYWNPNLAIAFGGGGATIEGMNANMIMWHDFRILDGAKRVLLINDIPGKDGRALSVLANGDIPFMADLSGFSLRLTAPHAINVAIWDIRRPEAIRSALLALGIDVIVLRSLVGKDGAAPPVEALRALHFDVLGIETEIDPIDPKYVEPNLDIMSDWNPATIFGAVDTLAWETAYSRFVANCGTHAAKEAAQ